MLCIDCCFFKQKTAYEMRISDWSSDVCSSDLLIIVDEAHETSLKQEDGVHYHARDVAVKRGLLETCPVVLASATPAIETRRQVDIGHYRDIKLPFSYGGAQYPGTEAIALSRVPPEAGRCDLRRDVEGRGG